MRFTRLILMRLRSRLLEMSPVSFCPLMRMRIYFPESPLSRRNDPIDDGAIDSCGIMRVRAPSRVVMPCSFISTAERTLTGVVVDFSRWWCPEPVTTTGFRLYTRSVIDESRCSMRCTCAIAVVETKATNNKGKNLYMFKSSVFEKRRGDDGKNERLLFR